MSVELIARPCGLSIARRMMSVQLCGVSFALQRVDQQFKLTMMASNLKRMARILFAGPQGAMP